MYTWGVHSIQMLPFSFARITSTIHRWPVPQRLGSIPLQGVPQGPPMYLYMNNQWTTFPPKKGGLHVIQSHPLGLRICRPQASYTFYFTYKIKLAITNLQLKLQLVQNHYSTTVHNTAVIQLPLQILQTSQVDYWTISQFCLIITGKILGVWLCYTSIVLSEWVKWIQKHTELLVVLPLLMHQVENQL